MSIKYMTAVWQGAECRGDRLVILLALADFANDDGYCWPKVKTLADKARASERWVQAALRELVDAEVLEIIEEGGGRGRSAMFRLTILDDGCPFAERVKRVNSGTERVKSTQERVKSEPRVYNIEPSNRTIKEPLIAAGSQNDGVTWWRNRYERGKARLAATGGEA